ncbi:SDR family NAD(P)-dependent oxidoreductase [uncultured Muribaculum sp.]|uniref:SDR family NAD(P)-dependent oxidoreductase n=1 Tax=uncultured Muribaculum sp. TaxID=1918613 RepID=UPI0025A9EA31|nr:SDR family NAD(P)-dependent oxidoreductase [uncultured Muribaculum sp.]
MIGNLFSASDCGVYIVTGATGGIGRAIVDGLAERGVKNIVLGVRNLNAGEKIARMYGGTVAVELLDLASFASVCSFASRILASEIPVRALINNAGVLASRKDITVDGYETTMQVNWLSPVLLSYLLMPRIEKGGSILFTTSFMRRVCRVTSHWHKLSTGKFNRFKVYAWSKLMLAQTARYMSAELRRNGIFINCTDPGIVDTEILRLGYRVVDGLADCILRPVISTPRQGAECTFRALEASDSGCVFTRRGCRPIAMRDSRHVSFSAVKSVINKAKILLNNEL